MSVLGGISYYGNLSCKADAVKYAISIATDVDKNNKTTVDLVLAKGIYNFITERVNLPDLTRDLASEACDALLESTKKTLNMINEKLEKETEVG